MSLTDCPLYQNVSGDKSEKAFSAAFPCRSPFIVGAHTASAL